MWDRNLCAYCGEPIPAAGGYGSGQIADGMFCRLKCFGVYHQMKLAEKAQLFKRTAGSGNGAH
jgi:hypothetical protein